MLGIAPALLHLGDVAGRCRPCPEVQRLFQLADPERGLQAGRVLSAPATSRR